MTADRESSAETPSGIPNEWTGPGEADPGDFEAITAPASGYAEGIEAVHRDARRRIAMIEINGIPVGTGVLVGPDILLTAAHVVESVKTPDHWDCVTARFDYVTQPDVSSHETGVRVGVASLVDYSPPSEAWEVSGDHLDYALLRLSERVPEHVSGRIDAPPRGHYTLDRHVYDFSRTGTLFISQHPLGMSQKVSHFSSASLRLNTAGTRIRYRGANTEKGSSGSPVITTRGRLVAIHHYSTGAENQGVPTSAIASSVRRLPDAESLLPVYSPPAPTANTQAVMLNWVPEDFQWASLVHNVLTTAGFRVLMGPQADGSGPGTVQEHLDAGGWLVPIVSPAYLADPEKLEERDVAVFPGDSTAPIRAVPVLVKGELEGALMLLPSVDMRGTDYAHARERLVAALSRAPGASRSEPLGTVPQDTVGFRPGDPLPRLQTLSSRALKSAGTVSGAVTDVTGAATVRPETASGAETAAGSGTAFTDAEESQFAAGLYVARDIEEDLARSLRAPHPAPVVLAGEAGCGKTSILWGMARRLCVAAGAEAEVFFVKATWLSPQEGAGARVSEQALTAAVSAARTAGRHVSVLLDTVDVLVNDDESWTVLVSIVEAAIAGGAAVMMTSRVAEAALLPSSWERFELRDYATGSTGTGADSEFARAVRAHSKFFTNDPRLREELVTRMLTTVARDLTLKPLCLRPLTLRMLFEIYTPGQVSQVVDTTGLYEAYWEHRVICDRRAWDGTSTHETRKRDRDVDLSAAAMVLALEMLRTGRPEAKITTARLPESMTAAQLSEHVRLLVERGVGQLAGGGLFQFFHQTFFEYVASRALIHGYGAGGISALVTRLQEQDDDDYFLLAVLEQTWLCADRFQEAAVHAAEAIGALLETFAGQPEGGSVAKRYGMRRAVLSVCAQSSLVNNEMYPALCKTIAKLDLPSLRRFLELLPAPGRLFGPVDVECLRSAVKRRDNAWIAVVEVLDRLAPKDLPRTLASVHELGLVELAVTKGSGSELTTRGEFPAFLVGLLPREPDAIGMLKKLVDFALKDERPQYVASILEQMGELSDQGRQSEQPEQVASWADFLLGTSLVDSSPLIKAHTSLSMSYLRTQSYEGLLSRLESLVDRLAAGPATTVDRSLLGAILSVIADRCPPGTDPEPFLTVFTRLACRELLADLSRGSLACLFASDSPVGTAVGDLAADWLAKGMPIRARGEVSDDDIRAKLVRTALARLDLPVERAASIAARAAVRWAEPDRKIADVQEPGESPALGPVRKPVDAWRSGDCLLHLLIRAVAAGTPEAVQVFADLPSSVVLKNTDTTAWIDPFRRPLAAPVETATLMDALLRVQAFTRATELLKLKVVPDHPSLLRLQSSAIEALRLKVPAERRDTMEQQLRTRLRALAKLLVTIDPEVGSLAVEWSELKVWLDRIPDPEVAACLIKLAGAALERDQYPYRLVKSLLRARCTAKETPGSVDCSTSDAFEARHWCLRWYAKYGSAEEIPEMFRLAFTEPLDANGLKKVSSYVFTDRREQPLTEEQSASLLLEMGRRINTCALGTAPRKDIARAWRAAMWSLLPTAETTTQLRVAHALPDLDDVFASNVAQCLSFHRRAELRSALEQVAASPTLGDRLKLTVNEILTQLKRHSSQAGWPHILQDLAGQLTSGG